MPIRKINALAIFLFVLAMSWSALARAQSAPLSDIDSLRYIASYPDLIQAFGADAAKGRSHYEQWGIKEGRRINFEPLYYTASHVDLISAFGVDETKAVTHYIQWGAKEGRRVTFDPLRYVATYPDLINAFGLDSAKAARHFIQYGFKEGRKASFSDLDALNYIASYGDLIAAFATDVVAGIRHYVTWGYKEGRKVVFDGLAYIASYADLIVAYGADAYAGAVDYIRSGFAEGRQINFDPSFYVSLPSNADVKAAFGSDRAAATTHYINYGFREGRTAFPGEAQLTLSETSVRFGVQDIGALGDVRTITLTHRGGTLVSGLSIMVLGENVPDFDQSNDCRSALSPGDTCRISLRFTPASGGAKSAQLSVSASASALSFSVNLSGTARSGSAATLPGAPVIASVTSSDSQASISFLEPSSSGGSAINKYLATCSTRNVNIEATGSSSPLTVNGLQNGTQYSCVVAASNSIGTGATSAAATATPRARAAGAPSIDYVFAMSGKIIDGYVSGATVYVDMNWSSAYEPGEPKTTTDSKGDWRFTVEDLKNFSCFKTAGDPRPIIADVPVGAVDLSSGVVKEAYQLLFLPGDWFGLPKSISVANVTPFTTLFSLAVNNALDGVKNDIAVSDSCGAAASGIAAKVKQSAGDTGRNLRQAGVDLANFYDDYIFTKNVSQQKKGEFIVEYLQQLKSLEEAIRRGINEEIGSALSAFGYRQEISYEVIKEIIESNPSSIYFGFRFDSNIRGGDGSTGFSIIFAKDFRIRSDGALVAASCKEKNPFACATVSIRSINDVVRASKEFYWPTRLNSKIGYRETSFRGGGGAICGREFDYFFGFEAVKAEPPKTERKISQLEFRYAPILAEAASYDCTADSDNLSYRKEVAFPSSVNDYFYSFFNGSSKTDGETGRKLLPYLTVFARENTSLKAFLTSVFDSEAAYNELSSLPSNPKDLDESKISSETSWYLVTGGKTEFATFRRAGADYRCVVERTIAPGTPVRSVTGTRDQALAMCYPHLGVF